jgi:hypothetical protein
MNNKNNYKNINTYKNKNYIFIYLRINICYYFFIRKKDIGKFIIFYFINYIC